jgi:hypothetical protein
LSSDGWVTLVLERREVREGILEGKKAVAMY